METTEVKENGINPSEQHDSIQIIILFFIEITMTTIKVENWQTNIYIKYLA